MVTSRFHKDEAVLQRDTMAGKVRSRRTIAFVSEIAVMLALFFVMVILLGPMTTSPFYFPLYPAIIVPLAFGAVLMGTGAYFKKRLYDMADLSEKPGIRARYGRVGLVFVAVFLALALVFIIAMPPLGDTNLAEQTMVREDDTDVGANTYIRLQFQGADPFGSYRAELTVTSRNNVTLDYYLLEKGDAEGFDPAAPPPSAISYRENASAFSYKGSGLKAQDYTLIISNLQNDTAAIHYKVFQRTSDGLSLFFILFFLVYVGIAGGWVAYIRSQASTETVPVIAPPVPGPAPQRPVMPGPPQPGMGMAARGPAQPEPGLSPEAGGVPMSITCPRCSTVFEVMRGAGPTKIKCPGCGKEGTLAGLPASALAAAHAQPAPAPQPAPAQQYAPQYGEPPVRPEYPVARMAQAGTGTSYPPSAPQSYAQPGPAYPGQPRQAQAQPAPAAGDMYAQPAAPPAPALPPSPYDQLMAMGLATPEPAIPEAPAAPVQPAPAAGPAAMPPPAAAQAPAPKKTIACPRCRQAFQIDKVEGPQHIKCPHCGKEGTIGARKPAAAAPPAVPVAAATAAAPAPAPAPAQRPAIQTPAPAAPAAPAAAPKMISCPACKRPFAVTETRRPLQVKCPACGKEGLLRK